MVKRSQIKKETLLVLSILFVISSIIIISAVDLGQGLGVHITTSQNGTKVNQTDPHATNTTQTTTNTTINTGTNNSTTNTNTSTNNSSNANTDTSTGTNTNTQTSTSTTTTTTSGTTTSSVSSGSSSSSGVSQESTQAIRLNSTNNNSVEEDNISTKENLTNDSQQENSGITGQVVDDSGKSSLNKKIIISVSTFILIIALASLLIVRKRQVRFDNN